MEDYKALLNEGGERLMTFLKLNQRTTTNHFRLPFDSVKEARTALHQSVIMEFVRKGGTEFKTSDHYKQQICAIGDWLCNQPTNGLLLCGKVGNGKTTMLDAIIALYTLGEFFDNGIKIGFKRIDALELTDIYNESRDEFKQSKRCPMLAIDDLGCENVEVQHYGNVLSPITELLAYRYQERLLTIVTTNLRPSQIKGRYGERIADRFREMMTVVVFDNESYR